jgi:hypothetical protein
MYQTIRLDFKEDMIGKTVFHSQYLFSDCVLTARSYLLIFAEKFLIKYTIPDTEPTKKSVSRWFAFFSLLIFFYHENYYLDK